MIYYDLKKNWTGKILPHLNNAKVQKVLVRDFNKYTWGRWRQKFTPGMLPRQFESYDWSVEHRGKEPRFWAYTKHAACHWLVNFTLELAKLAEPKKAWRIISSQEHSTVWDGEGTIFDFNFSAFGIESTECFKLAKRNGVELPLGKHLKVYMAEHYSLERRK